MIWKLTFILIFTNCILSFDLVPNQNERNALEILLEQTYPTYSEEAIDDVGDVGEPLLLTPFIEQQKIEEARQAALVDDKALMPGVESYAGYLTVNKEYNGNLWFWYFPVANESIEETPFIIWLQGGPGVSSLFGVFEEIGPFVISSNYSIIDNPHSWGKNHSLLFIDNPVGGGFSFTDDDGCATNQTTIGEHLSSALQQFLTIFPELRKAPTFIAGEGYGGKHALSLGIQIHSHKDDDEPVNLQGLAIGNGFIDPISLQRYSSFAREVGLVNDVTAEVMFFTELAVVRAIESGNMRLAFSIYSDLLNTFKFTSKLPDFLNYVRTDETRSRVARVVKSEKMRCALHVGSTKFSRFEQCFEYLILDFMSSTKPWLEELLNHYRVLLYSGHLDCMVPYHVSVNMYKSLNFPGAEEYKTAKRFPWYHHKSLAGYFKSSGKLTEVMVRSAGLRASMDMPFTVNGLMSAFILDKSLKEDTSF